ncbi:hypothetical protein [uncultured Tenacibaculum sp.]|uniref:hypothetical protein n=1 Tax=uncultured Tenacibaculum sp. TaxID=174713 RepID=UPI00260F69A3|nr:hypothetical protein [uncultured Tenacibaculum sp.]
MILIGITVFVIFFLNYKIETDISYHSGKDNGYFKRFESVIILSVIFYVVISKQKRILYGCIGFLVSIISSFIGMIISNSLPKPMNVDSIIHLVVFAIAYLSLFGIERLIDKTTTKKTYN